MGLESMASVVRTHRNRQTTAATTTHLEKHLTYKNNNNNNIAKQKQIQCIDKNRKGIKQRGN